MYQQRQEQPTGQPPLRPRVAVVGGGISGLAAAWALRDDARVVVLEQSRTVGGALRVGELGGIEVDLGAESFLARRPEAVGLVRELGLDGDLVHPATTAANVVRDGRLHPLPARTVLGVPADPGTLLGLLTAGEVARVRAEADLPPFRVAHRAQDVDVAHRAQDVDVAHRAQDVDVAGWVAGRLGPAVVDRLVEPLLGGVYAGHARLLSARATLPALWAATEPTLLAAAGAVLAAGSVGPVFAGLRGGVGRLPQHLAGHLVAAGVGLRTGVTVRALERRGDGWRLTLGPVSAPEFEDVDAVVLAVPPAPAARLLRSVAPVAAAQLGGVETASVAVVACLLPRASIAGVPGSGVLVPPAEGRPVKAITFSSAKWAWTDALDRDHVVVRLSLGRHREEAVLQRDDDDLVRLAVADAADLLGRSLQPVATRLIRWGGALPQPAVGHIDRVARVRAAVAEQQHLAVCGAALDGVGIPACLASARLAADQLRGQLAGVRRSGRAAGQPAAAPSPDR